MDKLAREGIFFSRKPTHSSGHVCSPTRAGLMLGRYQQRVGIYTAGDGGRGIIQIGTQKTTLELPIFPAFLPSKYVQVLQLESGI